MKRYSLLEEIQGCADDNYSRGEHTKPIIIVPSTEVLGNICLKNAVSFLSDGKYIEPAKVTLKAEEKNETKRTFT